MSLPSQLYPSSDSPSAYAQTQLAALLFHPRLSVGDVHKLRGPTLSQHSTTKGFELI